MSHINGTMMQYFHWYIDPDVILWNEVKNKAPELAKAGFTAIWLPPAYKGMAGTYDVGYGVYDMYDLGEFEQKGTVRTKYGDRQQYLDAIKALQSCGMQVYADTVLNHRMGGEDTEVVKATPFSQDDRINPKGWAREIKAYTHYAFPGRNGKYSGFEWHWWHFDAVDYDDFNNEPNTIYLLDGKVFDDYVALEKGNYAYLMGCDVDFQTQEVREEITRWGKWYLDTTGVDGFRLDAIKHISAWFFPIWLDDLEKYTSKDLFAVGEYWYNDVNTLHWYVDAVAGKMSVLDVPLHYNFHYASKSGGNYDMRRILDDTMMQQRPTHAVTFVENHDSQPLQALEAPVEPWFKPLAYAIILLRAEGYPCVFYADYYGAEYEDWGRDGNRYKIVLPSHRWLLDKFLYARQNFAYGAQYDYFDHWNTIGWTRLGDEQHPKAMAVIMSDGPGGSKWMEVGKPNAKFCDLTEHIKEPVYTNEAGWGEFWCNGGSVSVWVQE
ncbi:MAG: alpha-amylase [Nostocaceae cyanobacterium]|nr:alpha-amylase [Nostocaceae cyanobacterium]